MNTEIRKIMIDKDKYIFVEVEIGEMEDTETVYEEFADEDYPDTEETGMGDKAAKAAKLLKENISNVSEIVHKSLVNMKPDEWTVEMNIGFKGEKNPIPFIVKGGIKGDIKISATWRK